MWKEDTSYGQNDSKTEITQKPIAQKNKEATYFSICGFFYKIKKIIN